MERYLDKSGEYLYIKYSFLENFKILIHYYL